MKREEDFRQIAIAINKVRIAQDNKPFSSADLKVLLKGILPTDCSSKVELVKCNIIIRIKKGQYCFPNNPVHWHCIRNFYNQARERSQHYRKPDDPTNEDILRMIEIIKAHGYVVFQRVL